MLTALTNFLLGWASHLGKTCLNFLIDFLQIAFDSFIDWIVYFIGLFPDCLGASCMDTVAAAPVGAMLTIFITMINWLFPVAFFVSVINFMTCGMMAFVIIAPVARWLKLIT